MRVKDKQGVLKTESQERLQSWVENLSKILNTDDPTNPVEERKKQENWSRLRKWICKDGEYKRLRIR